MQGELLTKVYIPRTIIQNEVDWGVNWKLYMPFYYRTLVPNATRTLLYRRIFVHRHTGTVLYCLSHLSSYTLSTALKWSMCIAKCSNIWHILGTIVTDKPIKCLLILLLRYIVLYVLLCGMWNHHKNDFL